MGLDNEDIKQLIAILQRGLTDDSHQEDSPAPKKTKSVKQTVKKTKKEKTQTKTSRVNIFDNMPESRMHKEDVQIDKKLNRVGPTPRRDAFRPLNVVCRVCGQTETVDPSIIESTDRYKCNKCSISAG